MSILTGQAVDDLEGGIDAHLDYRSLLHGMAAPTVRRFDTLAAERQFLVGEIRAFPAK